MKNSFRIPSIVFFCGFMTISCKPQIEAEPDPSGLSEAELNSPISVGKDLTREDLNKLKKGGAFYTERLKSKELKTADEWMRAIDCLHAGMLMEQVEAILPRNSMGGSSLWAYDGMRVKDVRQTMIWALDAKHAVAVEVNNEGDRKWDAAGKPSPRTKHFQNRITSKPILLFHNGQLDDYGVLSRDQCRLR